MAKPYTSLYVHVPFCAAKCDYCAFYSVAGVGEGPRADYLRRLDGELARHAPECAELASVYVGGGTPTFLPVEELEALLSSVRSRLIVPEAAEFTVECNPDSLTPVKVEALARCGVNRVSLGVQSFRADLRRVIGRRGNPGHLDEQLESLRGHGIANIGLDLIYAIPGQSLDDWRADLCRAVGFGPVHLSTYELTVEEATALGGREKCSPDEELVVEMWHATEEVAAAAGLARYEVSNLALPGFECRHNQDVWHGGTYLGVGPAAVSFDGETHRSNPADLERWLRGSPPEPDALPPADRARETLGLGLRTATGWHCGLFRERTGFGYLELCGSALRALAADGLLELTDDRVQPTQLGMLFADRVARRLMDS